MGTRHHHAILVTVSDLGHDDVWPLLDAARAHAEALGMETACQSAPGTNGVRTLMVCPDGWSEGRSNSDEGDARRAAFRKWLRAHDDCALEWVEVAYGTDHGTATIEGHTYDDQTS